MKNDINLLYKRKVKTYSNKNITSLFLIILLIGGVAFFAIKLPSDSLQAAKIEAAKIEKELISSSVDKEELSKKRELKTELDMQLAELNVLKETKAHILYYVEKIEQSQPTHIILKQLSIEGESINLLGIADSDRTIAIFCLRLREQNVFRSIFLQSSLTSEDDGSVSFVIKIMLPSTLNSAAIIMDLKQNNDAISNTSAGGN